MAYSPMIYEQTPRGEMGYGLWARLLKERIIYIGTPLNEQVSNLIIAQMLFLEADDAEKPIIFYINSPGGSVNAGLAVYDAMQYVRSEIQTVCLGFVASVSALLLAGGNKGKRFALPNTRILLHQPYGGAGGTAADIEVTTRELLRRKQDVIRLFAKCTGKDTETIEKDIDRNFYLNAEQAIEYGLLDEVVANKEEVAS